jgi:hypothetical protein
METLNPLEKAVLEKLLSGESETYRILQKQYSTSRGADRKMTGVGFFTRLSLSDDAPKLPDEATFHIADVAADISDLEHGAGFVLFIRKGGSTCSKVLLRASRCLVMFVAFICTTMVRRKENDADWKRTPGHAAISAYPQTAIALAALPRPPTENPVPSLIKFLLLAGILAGIIFGGMIALVTFVEPQPREMSQTIPPARLNK